MVTMSEAHLNSNECPRFTSRSLFHPSFHSSPTPQSLLIILFTHPNILSLARSGRKDACLEDHSRRQPKGK